MQAKGGIRPEAKKSSEYKEENREVVSTEQRSLRSRFEEEELCIEAVTRGKRERSRTVLVWNAEEGSRGRRRAPSERDPRRSDPDWATRGSSSSQSRILLIWAKGE